MRRPKRGLPRHRFVTGRRPRRRRWLQDTASAERRRAAEPEPQRHDGARQPSGPRRDAPQEELRAAD
ncbi:MAG: hypothetical protein RMK01_01720 [Thermomicrobium sp.]|nr:hypothetical protein [Thermomicrobium sp.]MDW8058774.1 hypothetical protein [Thermomicrobium sp.]